MCDIKGASTIDTTTIKGYGAARETIELLRNSDIGSVSNVSPYNNYYLYHYLMTSGEFEWNYQKRCFEKSGEDVPLAQALEINRKADVQGNYLGIGRTAGSWGLSMESLSDIFADPGVKYALHPSGGEEEVLFEEPLYGDDADFMYIDFQDMDQNYQYILFNHNGDAVQKEDPLANSLMKKDYNRGMTVTISWNGESGDDTLECSMHQGQLLIPLGTGRDWLLNKHDKIKITVLQDGNVIEMPKINGIQFLKLREAK